MINKIGYSNLSFKSNEVSEHRAWVKQFNASAASGRLGGFTHEKLHYSPRYEKSAIPTVTDEYAVSQIKQAVKELKAGSRKKYASIIMRLHDCGCDDIIRKLLPSLIK